MVSPPPPTACEALTARGEPCHGYASYRAVDLGDRGEVRTLCGYHWQLVQHRPIAFWNRPIDPAALAGSMDARRRWTAEDDALLRAHAGEPVATVASLLGRTLQAVYKRRSRLRQEGQR